MSNEFEVQCEIRYDSNKTYIEITFSKDWDDIFSYEYEIGKDETVEARKSIDNFQIYLNENNIEYDKEELDSLKDEIVDQVKECLKESADEEDDETFNKSVTFSSLRNNECKFSYNCINKLLDKVRNGDANLTPDGKSAPKSLDFVNSDEDRCFAYIETIYVFPINATDKINSTEFGRNSFICGFKDKKSQKTIILTLGFMDISRRSPELKYYQFENVELLNAENGMIYLYDINEAKVTVQTNCDFTDILMPYHDYYSLCLNELENKNDNQKMTVALDFLHDYYVEIDNLTVDQGSSIIPIRGKTFRFKEVQIDCTINNKVEQYPFYGGEIHLLNEEDTNEIYTQLKEQGIDVPNNISFIRFNYSELGDKDQNIIESLIASGKYDKIQIGYNIIGDITRTKRVIDGIEKCLLGEVTNPRLVELICSNNTNEIISSVIDSNEYTPNEDYIKELKDKYWTLKENEEQIRAIDKIVQMDKNNADLMLVQGPPGTGKTELILSLIKELYHLNYKVLVTSNVQVACDNIVDRLRNFRNIPLKRYSTIKGEKYEKEVLENEQKYVKNQVLAGFSLILDTGKTINITLDSRESYNQLLSIKKEFDDKVLLIESEKQKYLDSLKEYNGLVADKETKNTLLKNLNEKLKKLEEDNKKILNEISAFESEISNSIEENKTAFEKISNLKAKNENDSLRSKELEGKLKQLFSSKEKETAKKREAELNSSNANTTIDTLNSSLINQRVLLERINSINTSFVYKQLHSYIECGHFENEEEYPTHFFNDVFAEITPLIDSGKFIKKVVSGDNDFLQNGKNLSLANFDSIYFKLKDNDSYCKLFSKEMIDSLKDIKQYYSISSFKRVMSSIFSFIKINGKTIQEYQEKISLFNDELKRIYYSFDSIIRNIIDQNYSENSIADKKTDISSKIESLQNEIADVNNRKKQYQKDITEAEKQLFIIGNDIEDSTKALDTINKELEKNQAKYNLSYSAYSSVIESINSKQDQLEKMKKSSSEVSLEIESTSNAFENEKSLYKDIETQINAYYEENQELIDDFESFMQSKEVAKVRCQKNIDSIQNVIDAFSDRTQTFVSAGWTVEDAENMLFNYAAELKKISEIRIDKDSSELKYCIDGQGTAFREMFELSDTGKGSVISMTTNQVASLLRSTTNDELTFDYAIIDEASKCTFEDVVISLPRIKHLILIGDFMQLDKLYQKFNQIDLKYQNTLSYSLWDSLNCSTFYQCLSAAVDYNDKNELNTFDNNPMVSVMKKQYRMNKGIFELVKPIYEIHKEFELIDQKQSTFNDLLCLQIDGEESQDDNRSSSNQKEGLAVVNILKEIAEHRDIYPGIKKIGVITGYRAQENFIRKNLKGEKKIAGLEIGTYDRFQGREYDLVLMSLVRTEKLGFNSNLRRMNVAISRAKNHLIILGNFEELLNVAKRTSYVNEEDFESNKEELEFVTKKLIPRLYNLKKKFPSEDAMKKAVIKFLKEEDNE